MRDARPRFKLEKERGFQLAEAFFTASRSGDMAALGALLAADVAFHADGGGKRRAVQRPVLGVEAVLRLHEALGTLFVRQNSHLVRVGLVNGLPGFVTRESDGELQTIALAIEEGKVRTIYVVRNPDKLQHLH